MCGVVMQRRQICIVGLSAGLMVEPVCVIDYINKIKEKNKIKCLECKYQNRCSLREIAADLTGCEGHCQTVPKTEE